MADTTIWIVTAIFLLFLGALGYAVYIILRKPDEGKVRSIFINLQSYLDGQRFIGGEIKSQHAKDGRHFITYVPWDIDPDITKKVKPVNSIIDSNKLIPLARGTASSECSITIGLPENVKDMHPALQESLFGKALIFMTELKGIENVHINMLEEGKARRNDILKKIGDGEATAELLKTMDGYMKDFLASTVQAKEKKTDSPFKSTDHTAGS